MRIEKVIDLFAHRYVFLFTSEPKDPPLRLVFAVYPRRMSPALAARVERAKAIIGTAIALAAFLAAAIIGMGV